MYTLRHMRATLAAGYLNLTNALLRILGNQARSAANACRAGPRELSLASRLAHRAGRKS